MRHTAGRPQGTLQDVLWLALRSRHILHWSLSCGSMYFADQWVDLCRSILLLLLLKVNLCRFWIPSLPPSCVVGLGKYFLLNSFRVPVPVGGRFYGWFPLAGLSWIPSYCAWIASGSLPTFIKDTSSQAHLLMMSLNGDAFIYYHIFHYVQMHFTIFNSGTPLS